MKVVGHYMRDYQVLNYNPTAPGHFKFCTKSMEGAAKRLVGNPNPYDTSIPSEILSQTNAIPCSEKLSQTNGGEKPSQTNGIPSSEKPSQTNAIPSSEKPFQTNGGRGWFVGTVVGVGVGVVVIIYYYFGGNTSP